MSLVHIIFINQNLGIIMIIHVVQEGETATSIAKSYGVDEKRFILENEIESPNDLAIGETLVVLYPDVTYTVVEGDTLGKIAEEFGVSVMQLLRNNAYLSNREFLEVGETLVISYQGPVLDSILVDGYAYPFIDHDMLKRTLPFLTYLSIFSYKITSNGEILSIDDKGVIELAKIYGVAPIMMITPLGTNQLEETNTTHAIISNRKSWEAIITQIVSILKEKGYFGININTPYILPGDRNLYVEFISILADRIKKEGFIIMNTFSLSSFELLTGTIYEGLDYKKIGELVDNTILISYEWGTALGVPSGTVSYDTLRNFISHMLELIPPEKVMVGTPSIGYLWKLPYESGVTKGMSINFDAAIQLAKEHNVPIKYDLNTESAYFSYITCDEYIVRFRDARSINAYAKLVPDFELSGLGIWNIMMYFPQLWLVLNSQYEIVKVT